MGESSEDGREAAGAPDEGDAIGHPLTDVELDELLARHASRARGLRAFGWLAAAALLAVLVVSLSGQGGIPSLFVPGPTPVVPGSQRVLFAANVTRGDLRVDGHAVADALPTVVALTPGQHTVELRAFPFRPLVCKMTVPGSVPGDTCSGLYAPSYRNAHVDSTTVNGQDVLPDLAIAFALTADDLDLPGFQVDASIRSVERVIEAAAVVASVLIEPGQHYATATGGAPVATAADALDAQLTAQPSLATHGNCPFGLCPVPGDPYEGDVVPSSGTTNEWLVQADVDVGWRIADVSGSSVAAYTYPTGVPRATMHVGLSYDARLGWFARLWPRDPRGAATFRKVAISLVADAGRTALGARLHGSPYTSVLTNAATCGDISGCALRAYESTIGASVNPALPTFLWRFGALLAADDLAHELLPALPLATPDERQAVGLG